MTYDMRRCRVGDIIPLRHAVLRPGRPVETAHFDKDELPTTIHYGLFLGGEPLVCLSLLQSGLPATEVKTFLRSGDQVGAEATTIRAWQLRGMATAEVTQGSGLGSRLLKFAQIDAQTADFSKIFWCNARLKAVPFYEKNGWIVISGEFDVPGIGPHFKMICSSI
jgi:L-Ala-D/L-Glu epimerase